MLELAVLGLLHEQPLHGYELKKRLGETLGSFSGVSFGSLYPALRRLEQAGAVEVVDGTAVGAAATPSTGSLSGDLAAARTRRRPRPGRRTRKAYRITDTGRALFTELASAEETSTGDEERAFALKLAFCRFLPADRRLELLDRRRGRLLERLDAVRRHLRSDRVADPYTRSLLEHRKRTTELDLTWVEDLAARERAGAHDPEHEGATT
jgi:DNA-binding PadR family transcriptional regulator